MSAALGVGLLALLLLAGGKAAPTFKPGINGVTPRKPGEPPVKPPPIRVGVPPKPPRIPTPPTPPTIPTTARREILHVWGVLCGEDKGFITVWHESDLSGLSFIPGRQAPPNASRISGGERRVRNGECSVIYRWNMAPGRYFVLVPGRELAVSRVLL